MHMFRGGLQMSSSTAPHLLSEAGSLLSLELTGLPGLAERQTPQDLSVSASLNQDYTFIFLCGC